MKRTPLKRRKRLSPISAKRSKESAIYAKERKKFLKLYPYCEANFDDCWGAATQVHHIKGRGKHYLDVASWLPVCGHCHRFIHDNPSTARDLGLLV